MIDLSLQKKVEKDEPIGKIILMVMPFVMVLFALIVR